MTETIAGITADDLIRAAAECLTCGKEHQSRSDCGKYEHGVTWASPDDGHSYRPRLRWDEISMLRTLAAELAAGKGPGSHPA